MYDNTYLLFSVKIDEKKNPIFRKKHKEEGNQHRHDISSPDR
jgi:hypothetical protein